MGIDIIKNWGAVLCTVWLLVLPSLLIRDYNAGFHRTKPKLLRGVDGAQSCVKLVAAPM